MSSFKYKSTTHAAVPRNGRLLDGRIYPKSGSSSSWTGNGGSVAQYWQLITQDADGNDLGEENYYLMPVDEVSVASAKDVVAFLTAAPVEGLPVATYDQLGLVKIKQGCGLSIVDGVLSVDEGAIGGGLDETQLEEYLTTNKYMKEGDGLTLSSKLTGYTIGESYPPLSADDTILSAFGKLEKNFDRYVDTYSNQSVDGIKTFAQTIYGNQDVVCYATGTVSASLPVASTSQLGLVKIGANLSIDANGVLSASVQAGGLTDCSPADSTSGYVTSITYNSSSKSLTYQRTTPKTLSWSYGSVTNASKGSYNSLAEKSFVIPNDTLHLTNGAEYINTVGSSKLDNFTSGTGNVVYAVGKDSDNKNKLNYYYYTRRFFESQTLNSVIEITSTTGVGGIKFYNNNGTRMRVGPGNGLFGWMLNENGEEVPGRVYINWESDSKNVQFDENHNIAAYGDIVAFATKSVVANTPIATTSQLGLVRVKSGGGIAIDSNGYLTCTVTGGGGGSSVTVNPIQTSGTKIATITVDGTDKNLYAPSVVSIKSVSQTTANTGAGQANTVSVLNTNNASIGTFTVYNGPQGPRGYTGYGVGSVSAHSTSSESGGQSIYYMYDTQNTYIGSFTVYNGKQGATGNIALGSTITSDMYLNYSKSFYFRYNSNNYWRIYYNTSNWNLYFARKGGASDSESAKGWVSQTGGFIDSSDKRLKMVLGDVSNTLEAINSIHVVRFQFINDETHSINIGVIAQDVQTVYPEIISESGDEMNYLGVNYSRLGVIALQACKELHSLHKSLDTRVSTIEQWRITTDTNKDALTKRVEALEQMIGNKTA